MENNIYTVRQQAKLVLHHEHRGRLHMSDFKF